MVASIRRPLRTVTQIARALVSPCIDWGLLIVKQCQYPSARLSTRLISKGVQLGDSVSINRGAELGEGTRIGDYSYVNAFTIIRNTTIGNFTSISYMCAIGLQ